MAGETKAWWCDRHHLEVGHCDLYDSGMFLDPCLTVDLVSRAEFAADVAGRIEALATDIENEETTKYGWEPDQPAIGKVIRALAAQLRKESNEP